MQLSRLVPAGFVATIVMSVAQALAPAMGMPAMNIAAMLGAMLGGSLVVGWIVHMMMGAVVWPIVYGAAVERRLSGAPWMRGAIYGLIVAAFVLVVGFPLAGAMFSSMAPKPGFLALGLGGVVATMGVLLGHLIYGVVLGALSSRGGTAE